MKFWKTYVAVAILAGLGAYVYFVESKKPDPNAKKKAFESVEKDKIREITIRKGDGEPLKVVKEGENWKLASPTQAPADTGMVGILLSAIESTEIGEVVIEEP